MGWAFGSADHVSNPTLGVHPLARSRCQGLVLGIVNPDATSSGRFGTIPGEAPDRHPNEANNTGFGQNREVASLVLIHEPADRVRSGSGWLGRRGCHAQPGSAAAA